MKFFIVILFGGLLCQGLLPSPAYADTTLTIQPKNCSATGIYRSLSYTFYWGYDYSLVKPLNFGEETTGALGFDVIVKGPSALQTSLSFVAPESVWNNNKTRAIPISFPASGPGESMPLPGGYPLNIHTTTPWNLHNGRNYIRLGCIFTVPFTPTQPDTFQTSIKCIVSYVDANDTSVAITDSALCNFNIIIFDNSLKKILHNGAISVRSTFDTYTVFFDTSTMTSRVRNNLDTEQVNNELGIDISGGQNRTISNKLNLPTYLENYSGNRIEISFPATGPASLARLDTKSFSNPHQLSYFHLGSFGRATFRLGYTVKIPPNTPAGIYTASVSVYNEYTLLDYPEPPILPPVTLTISVAIDTANSYSPFHLKQNYPNPFNPGTDISFTVLSATVVDLSIYNVLGQKMETIFSGPLPHGEYKKHWDASSYPGGVYIYKLQSDDHLQVKKLLLLK